MYCKCKDNTSFQNSYNFNVGEIYSCYWCDDQHTEVCIAPIMPWDVNIYVKRADFLRCFDYWE
ncbi:MAG: hypothetical protein IKX36_12135 [Prevotella sp.]|nr:hypothetical protein [Prevotella sp.]